MSIVIIMPTNCHIDIAYFTHGSTGMEIVAWAKEARMADGLSPKPRDFAQRTVVRPPAGRCNLEGRFRCRFAAEALVDDHPHNYLLRLATRNRAIEFRSTSRDV